MRIKTILLFLCLTSLLFGCVQNHPGEEKNTLFSNFISITDNENSGINEILEYYGGRCEYAVGRKFSTNGTKINYFVINLSNSTVVDTYANVAEMPASNIAYLFYRNLKEEKNAYDQIQVRLQIKKGEVVEFVFSGTQLEQVDDRIPTIREIVGLIKRHEFESIASYLNDQSVYDFDKLELVKKMEEAESQFGKVKFHAFWI